jgi:hypothetical protein
MSRARSVPRREGHCGPDGIALALVACALAAAAPATVRAQPASPYEDLVAEALHVAAIAARERIDDSVLQYTAKVRRRFAAALRTPLKDRTLYRMESAHRVFWNRDGDMLVQVLALREQSPAGEGEYDSGLFDQAFDPMDDRLLFGFARRGDDLGDPGVDDFWFEHPLFLEYRDRYRFASGDTLTLSLPDGRRVRAVELRVVPTVADVHRMAGSLWIEPETGSLVRAIYRLSDTFDAMRDVASLRAEREAGSFRFVPGLFTPWTAHVSLIAVDYSLWDFGIWLPRSLRAEGVFGAGIVKLPLTIDVGYEMEAVITKESAETGVTGDDVVESVHFRTRREAMAYLNQLVFGDRVPYVSDPEVARREGRRITFLVPEDTGYLRSSPDLPPPVWQDGQGFASRADLDAYAESLARLPIPPLVGVPATFRWGFQHPDLVRYNRVEALSLGMRAQVRPNTESGPLSVTATARLGVADLHPNGVLELAEETLDRRVSVRAYHELAPIDERARHLEIGNSLLAATIGRDDGDYYRRSGVALDWRPPTLERRTYRLSAWAEHHREVRAETDFALFRIRSDSWHFRPNLAAERGWEFGGGIDLTPYWGSDPNLVQGGLDLTVQAAAGDFEYARSALVARLVVPLPARLRVALEAGAGTAWGAPSVQRLWTVGGPGTLRGYEPLARAGTSFWRGRAELARGESFGRLALFSDVGWAGERGSVRWDDALYSVGVGVSILDGLIRLDGAWGLRSPRDFRLDFYLDQLL